VRSRKAMQRKAIAKVQANTKDEEKGKRKMIKG
jgi:hypothetical protein